MTSCCGGSRRVIAAGNKPETDHVIQTRSASGKNPGGSGWRRDAGLGQDQIGGVAYSISPPRQNSDRLSIAPEPAHETLRPLATTEERAAIRDAVRAICDRFDDAYWAEKDRSHGFPHEFKEDDKHL